MSSTRRPRTVTTAIVTLGVFGIAALGGGIELVAFPHGNSFVPSEHLDDIPLLDTFTVPGVILGLVFGIGSLVTAFGMARRWDPGPMRLVTERTGHHWSWWACGAIGVAFALWLVVEIALLGGPEAFEEDADRITAYATYAVFGTIAIALMVLPWTRSMRDHLSTAGSPVEPGLRSTA